MSKTDEATSALRDVITGSKEVVTSFLSTAKDAIFKIAPEIWKMIKMKVIADAVVILIFVVACSGTVYYFFTHNYLPFYYLIATVIIGSYLVGLAARRIIASDYMTLLEILNLSDKIPTNKQ